MIRLIAHQIVKQQGKKETTLVVRDALLPSESSIAGEFVQELKSGFTNRSPLAGKFARPAGGKPPFEQRLARYMAKMDDAAFVGFSQDATQLLADEMKAESFATGGYVVFAEYEMTTEKYLLVAVLSTKAQPSFDAKLNLIASLTLDFEHLRHGGRVRHSGVAKNDAGVVHFVSKSAEKVSDYFRKFLGCEALTDSAAQGRTLFTVLGKFADETSMKPAAKEEMMQKTHSYWKECTKNGRPMSVQGLSNYLSPNEPTVYSKYLAKEEWGLAGEFPPPSSKVMRCFLKFTYASSDLKLEFNREAWLGKISVNKGNVTIKDAPPELIRELEEALGD